MIVVTNEKRQFVSFYLPSEVGNRFKYSLPEFSDDIRAPRDGLYILLIDRPQSWMFQLWGLNLEQWREKFVPLHEFVNEKGQTIGAVYYLTQEQIDREFH